MRIIAIIIALVILISLTSVGGIYAAADEGGIDNTDVLSDLKNMTIDGEKFNVEDYPASDEGSPQIIAFVEYCFSYYANNQGAYSLYIYLYNPAQLDIKDDGRNKVQFAAGDSQNGYDKYSLLLLSCSEDNLFYKFRVNLSEGQKQNILDKLDNTKRIYDVSGIELYTDGANAEDYEIQRKYTYSGFAKGYGADVDSDITLTCVVEGGTESVNVTAHHTTWYPEGSKPGNTDLQESLTSVYFAVPKEYSEKYDYLAAAKVQWLNARTIPILVTGNSEIYAAVDELNNVNSVSGSVIYPNNIAPDTFNTSNFNYALLTDYSISSIVGAIQIVCEGMYFKGSAISNLITGDQQLETLFWYLQSDNMDVMDSADEYIVPSSKLLDSITQMSTNGIFYNDRKVAGKYPSYLFESWEDEYHVETIEVGKNYTLSSETVSNGWWEKLWGYNNVVDSATFKNIRAIQPVESLTGNAEVDCANYFIGESDYEEFYDFYYANKDDSTVYLLRFATSDRYQHEVTQFRYEDTLYGVKRPVEIDTNAYFFQTDVYLDFDIIQLEYQKGESRIVIPVVMSPVDIFPQQPPPVYVTSDVKYDFWKYAFLITAILVVFYIIYRIVAKYKANMDIEQSLNSGGRIKKE